MTYTIENPAATTNDCDTLRITTVGYEDQRGGIRLFADGSGNPEWSLSEASGMRVQTLTLTSNGTDRISRRKVRIPGDRRSRTLSTAQQFAGACRRRKRAGPGRRGADHHRSFYTDSGQRAILAVAIAGESGRLLDRYEIRHQRQRDRAVSSCRTRRATPPPAPPGPSTTFDGNGSL